MRTVSIEVLEEDHLLITVETSQGTIRALGEVRWEPGKVYLDGVHVEGPGANKVGLRELYAGIQDILQLTDVDTLVIQGGNRTTGANPGRYPRPIILRKKRVSGT